MILIDRNKFFLLSCLVLKRESDFSMKNVIYKYFISQICWGICIILVLLEAYIKLMVSLVTFLIFKEPLFRVGITKVKGLLLKKCVLKKIFFFINSFKIVPSKNTFSKLLSWKLHFLNCFLKKILSSNCFKKFWILFQNCSLEKHIFKITLKKYIFKIARSKNIFLKLLS